jgi:hypothetical protein
LSNTTTKTALDVTPANRQWCAVRQYRQRVAGMNQRFHISEGEPLAVFRT